MASGDVIAKFDVSSVRFPSSGYPAFDKRGNPTYPHLVLDFDDTADQEVMWTDVLDQLYGGGGLTVYVYFAMSSATSGNVVWQGAFERIGNDLFDIDNVSFAANQSSGQVSVPTSSGNVAVGTITFTDGAQMDSVAVGELYRFKLRRDGDSSSATDDATGDAELLYVEIRES